MDEKAQALLKLFMCFPSTTGLSEETSAMMVASYLETLSTFSPDTLAKACDSFKRRSTRFAPSVGEIYERCAELKDKEAKQNRLLTSAQPKRQEPTAEQKERMLRRFEELKAELAANKVGLYAEKNNRSALDEARKAQKYLETYQGHIEDSSGKTQIAIGDKLQAYFDRVFPVIEGKIN
jgi:hypothetical protein